MTARWHPFSTFLLIAAVSGHAVSAQDIRVVENDALELRGDDVLEIAARPAGGFHFPFFLFVPSAVERDGSAHLLVEPNNTGTTSDDLDVHRDRAADLVRRSHANRLARQLHVPLLVPVFPRPASDWRTYTHALDRDSLEIRGGPLERIDRQLLAMIDCARGLLAADGAPMSERVFLDGFSASAKFCNRFAFLHPERVQAVATGGVNGLPTLPLAERNGVALPFPIGIADIEVFTGQPFARATHARIAQYVYMGYLDRNDTLPARDAWSEEEARIIATATAATMMPDRWQVTRSEYERHLPRAQCVTYNGVAHAITNEIVADLAGFFRANSGDGYAAIEPHAYPFVPYRELREVHVDAVYAAGDPRLPEFAARGIGERSFLIGIREWLPGQDHRQLGEFVDHAGFGFSLMASGQPDIAIGKANCGGSCSDGNGGFQGFYLRLDERQWQTMAADVPYALQAGRAVDGYRWIVADGLHLVRPANHADLVRAALVARILPEFAIDADV
ncbi:MAG: hypothetical protein KDC98_04675, partial [Planctomycetes bacterium]|nr:hypothetical protein [Planctomycetota bacterium]